METSEVSFTAQDVMALRQKTGLGMMDCKEALKEANGDLAQAEEVLRAKRKGKMDKRTERTTGEGRIAIAIDGDKAAIVEVQTETDFTARNEAFVKATEAVAQLSLEQPAGELSPTDEMTKHIDELRITTGENARFARGEKLEGGTFGAYVHHDAKRAALVQVDGEVDTELLKGICQHIVFHDPKAIDQQGVPQEEIDRIREDAINEAKDSGKPEEIAQKIADGKVRKFLEQNTLLNQPFVLDE